LEPGSWVRLFVFTRRCHVRQGGLGVAVLFEPVAFAAAVDHPGAVPQPVFVSARLIPVPEDCIAELVYPVLTCPMKFELSALFAVFPLANFFPCKRSRLSALPHAFKTIRRGRALSPARSMTRTAKSCIYRFYAQSAGADARLRPNFRLSHLERAAFLARTSVGVTPLESVFTQTTGGAYSSPAIFQHHACGRARNGVCFRPVLYGRNA
jgi:hypothetical protein